MTMTNLTTEGFRECALQALEELDAHAEPTEIRRVDAWINMLTSRIRNVQSDFAGDALGERSADAEDISYSDVEGEY